MVDPRSKPKLTDDERNIVAQWLLQHSSNGKLKWGAKKEASQVFNLDVKSIWKIWKVAASQQIQGIPIHVKSMKKGATHADKWSIDANKVKALSVLQRSSVRVMAENMGVSKSLIHNCVKKKELEPHTNAIKPHLTPENMLTRLRWSLSQLGSIIEGGKVKYQTMHNTIHVDEKWFYLTKHKDRYYMMPGEIRAYRACKSKKFSPKIMFNCAISRPVIDREGNVLFDGKFDIFPFIQEEPAQRNSKNRSKGTMEIHPIPAITRQIAKNQLINEMVPVIKAKWPTFLGKHIFIQQDNAKLHIQDNDPDFMAVARSDGFEIHLVCQPPNSPDTNVNDLGFFRAIQSLKDQKPTSGIQELLHNVKEAYANYPPSKINDVFLTLQGCYTEIMKQKGGNDYKIPHMGKGHLARLGELPECLEVDEALVRESLEYLKQHAIAEDRFLDLDKLIEGLEQVDLDLDKLIEGLEQVDLDLDKLIEGLEQVDLEE